MWKVVAILLLMGGIQHVDKATDKLARVDTDSFVYSGLHLTSSPPLRPVAEVIARKALAGVLLEWQRKAYTLCLEQKPRIAGLARVTHYGPPHFPRGAGCRWGYNCSESTAAANSILGHSYVLLELSTGWEMRRIEDTGAKWNDGVAREEGCKLWIDRWTENKRELQSTWKCRYIIIKGR